MPQYATNGLLLEAELLTPPAGGGAGAGAHPAAGGPRGAAASDGLPVLLVMGLGMQLTAWPEAFVSGLLARGHPVLRFDNRDIGLSARREEWGRPNLALAAMRQAFGMRVPAPYTLYDMAADTVGLLDALALPKVHLVGVSMGGMIGQIVAALHPRRVASFTCIMSSSGARHLPGPTPAVRRVLFSRPERGNPQAAIEHFVRLLHAIGSPGYPTPEERLREQVTASVQRSNHPLGTLRQMMAIAATGDRSHLLRDIVAPACLVHGSDDPLLPVAAAHDLARKIPGAELRVIDGMGHDLPEALLPVLLEAIETTIARAQAGAA